MSNTFNIINLQYTIIREQVPSFIYAAIKDYTDNSNAYHSQPVILREKLAEKYNIPLENIMLTAGIDEAIELFAIAYGKESIIFTPTYTVYEEIPNFGPNNLKIVPSLNNNEYVVEAKYFPEATLICLVNPNNPCGEIPIEEIERMAKLNPHAIITVDEAYGEFVQYSAIPLVQRYPNIAVMRSFSKAYGLAGARVGCVLAQPEIINKLKTKTQWCNVSYLSIGAAIAALEHEDYYVDMRKRINREHTRLSDSLLESPFTLIPSQINAALVKFSTLEKAESFVNYLKENNIIVSHGNGNSNCGLDQTFVRISIGTEDQMNYAKEIIKKYKAIK